MTKDELSNLIKVRPIDMCPFIYADKEGLTAHERNHGELKVKIGTSGMIKEIKGDSIVVEWDHYYFENHDKQELFFNPTSVISFDKLELIRKNKYPEGFTEC